MKRRSKSALTIPVEAAPGFDIHGTPIAPGAYDRRTRKRKTKLGDVDITGDESQSLRRDERDDMPLATLRELADRQLLAEAGRGSQKPKAKPGRKRTITEAERNLVRKLHPKIASRELAWKDVPGIVSKQLGTKERTVSAYRDMLRKKKRGK